MNYYNVSCITLLAFSCFTVSNCDTIQKKERPVKKSRNEWKQLTAQENMISMEALVEAQHKISTIQQNLAHLQKNISSMQNVLINCGKQQMYQPKESIFASGGANVLQQLDQELRNITENAIQYSAQLTQSQTTLHTILYPTAKQNKP